MDKKLVDQIDYYNNIFWLLNAALDIICDFSDLMEIQKEIIALVIF